jgi:hypothetical protein
VPWAALQSSFVVELATWSMLKVTYALSDFEFSMKQRRLWKTVAVLFV